MQVLCESCDQAMHPKCAGLQPSDLKKDFICNECAHRDDWLCHLCDVSLKEQGLVALPSFHVGQTFMDPTSAKERSGPSILSHLKMYTVLEVPEQNEDGHMIVSCGGEERQQLDRCDLEECCRAQVSCDSCKGWFHSVCANSHSVFAEQFRCQDCHRGRNDYTKASFQQLLSAQRAITEELGTKLTKFNKRSMKAVTDSEIRKRKSFEFTEQLKGQNIDTLGIQELKELDQEQEQVMAGRSAVKERLHMLEAQATHEQAEALQKEVEDQRKKNECAYCMDRQFKLALCKHGHTACQQCYDSFLTPAAGKQCPTCSEVITAPFPVVIRF
jgi:hypothetical protein